MCFPVSSYVSLPVPGCLSALMCCTWCFWSLLQTDSWPVFRSCQLVLLISPMIEVLVVLFLFYHVFVSFGIGSLLSQFVSTSICWVKDLIYFFRKWPLTSSLGQDVCVCVGWGGGVGAWGVAMVCFLLWSQISLSLSLTLHQPDVALPPNPNAAFSFFPDLFLHWLLSSNWLWTKRWFLLLQESCERTWTQHTSETTIRR